MYYICMWCMLMKTSRFKERDFDMKLIVSAVKLCMYVVCNACRWLVFLLVSLFKGEIFWGTNVDWI